jgi:hypothetical protein
MGKQVFVAKNMLLGAMSDARLRIESGQCKLAKTILQKKIEEIDRLEKCPYTQVVYD